jgi:hypothetical protein
VGDQHRVPHLGREEELCPCSCLLTSLQKLFLKAGAEEKDSSGSRKVRRLESCDWTLSAREDSRPRDTWRGNVGGIQGN